MVPIVEIEAMSLVSLHNERFRTSIAILVTAIIAGGTSTVMPAPGFPASQLGSSNWTMAYDDEFDAGSLAKWNVRDDASFGVLSYDRAIIDRHNARVSGGVLHLEGRRLSLPVNESGLRWFSTAYIDTAGKFSQKYGKWEMRAKLPLSPGNSQGIWPAFWLRPDGGATDGEIDIMEAYGTPSAASFDPQDRTQGTLHYDQSGTNKTTAWTPVTPGLSNEFHVWSFEWTPWGMSWLLDGKEYMSVERINNGAYENLFETPAKFHMRMNLQYGSPYWGMPDAGNSAVTKSYADYQIDYVRVWSYRD